jgi:hypothetical protein
MVRNCCRCGEPLEFKGGNHKYCNSCSENMKKERSRVAMRKSREKQKIQFLIEKGAMKLCENCGAPFVVNGANHRYCTICSENIRKENLRFYYYKYYYRRLKDVRRSDVLRPPPMGTGGLSGNPKSDFDAEHKIIRRELKRLGIRSP